MSSRRCASPSQPAFTLVECLVALAIVATCVTSLIVARTDAIHQAHRAAIVAAATDTAEQLAAEARLNGIAIAGTTTGAIDLPVPLHHRRTSHRLTVDGKPRLWQVHIEVFTPSDETPVCDVTFWMADTDQEATHD